MSRPAAPNPTPNELEVLKVLWERGPSTVREVLDALGSKKKRAYTSVMSLLVVMHEKGLLTREQVGRAFVYNAARPQERTLGRMLRDLRSRAFEGSSSRLVSHLLEDAKPSDEELQAIRDAIAQYEQQQEDQA